MSTKRKCYVDGCDQSLFSQGYCREHYAQAQQGSSSEEEADSTMAPPKAKPRKSKARTKSESSGYSSSGSTGGGTSMQRKMRKNTREKQRRLELNDRFEKLRAMLPMPKSTKQRPEKHQVLSEAAELIRQLRTHINESRQERAKMQMDMKVMAQELQARGGKWPSQLEPPSYYLEAPSARGRQPKRKSSKASASSHIKRTTASSGRGRGVAATDSPLQGKRSLAPARGRRRSKSTDKNNTNSATKALDVRPRSVMDMPITPLAAARASSEVAALQRQHDRLQQQQAALRRAAAQAKVVTLPSFSAPTRSTGLFNGAAPADLLKMNIPAPVASRVGPGGGGGGGSVGGFHPNQNLISGYGGRPRAHTSYDERRSTNPAMSSGQGMMMQHSPPPTLTQLSNSMSQGVDPGLMFAGAGGEGDGAKMGINASALTPQQLLSKQFTMIRDANIARKENEEDDRPPPLESTIMNTQGFGRVASHRSSPNIMHSHLTSSATMPLGDMFAPGGHEAGTQNLDAIWSEWNDQ